MRMASCSNSKPNRPTTRKEECSRSQHLHLQDDPPQAENFPPTLETTLPQQVEERLGEPLNGGPSFVSGEHNQSMEVEDANVQRLGQDLQLLEEVTVNYNTDEDRTSLEELTKDYPQLEVKSWEKEKVAEATQILEMFLVAGVGIEIASRKIVELYSPRGLPRGWRN